jgi:beta-glucosidase
MKEPLPGSTRPTAQSAAEYLMTNMKKAAIWAIILGLSSALRTTCAAEAATGANSAATNTAVIPVPRMDKLKWWTASFQERLRYAEKSNAEAPAQVIFDGDSITDFFRSRGKEVWQRYEANYHAIDFGISGDSTENVLYRLEHGQAQGMHPKLIFLMIGHNNVMHNTPEQIFDGVAAIIKKYEEVCPDSLIVLQATFPSKEPGSTWRTSIASLDRLLPKLADPGKVIYVDFGDKFLSPDGTLSKEVMPDGTHPAIKGYQIWAAAIQPILDQYCRPQ